MQFILRYIIFQGVILIFYFFFNTKSTVFSKRDLQSAARLLCADITNAETSDVPSVSAPVALLI